MNRPTGQRWPTVVLAHAGVLAASVFVGLVIGAAFGSGCLSIESMMIWHLLIHTAATLVGFGVLAGVLFTLHRLIVRRQRT